MTWRNLRITGKLLVGFGGLLFIFVLAVFFVWRSLSDAQDRTAFLSDSVIPGLIQTMDVERAVYELIVAIKNERLAETESSIKEVEARKADVQKLMDDVVVFGRSHTALNIPARLESDVMPVFKNYNVVIDRLSGVVRDKTAALKKLSDAAKEMADSSGKITEAFYEIALDEVKRNDTSEMERRVTQLYHVASLSRAVEKLRCDAYIALDARDYNGLQALVKDIDAAKATIQSVLKVTRADVRRNMLNAVTTACDHFSAAVGDAVAVLAAEAKVNKDAAPLTASMSDLTSELTKMGTDRSDSLSTENENAMDSVIKMLLVATAISVVIGVLIAVVIASGISKPLNTIVGLAKRAEGGDLTIDREDFGYEGKDEMGVLVNAIANMVTAQEATLKEVVSVSESLADGAVKLSEIAVNANSAMGNIKTSIDQVSTLSENNGAALEECNAGIEEMSAGADTVAQSATDSAAFISQTTDVSNKAIQMVNNAIQGMHEVDKNSKASEDKIKQLVASVENVSGFVSVITGIADQTNLLALNAAIEAARAGEVGRGFAVVAEEVRKLAEESARAAQNVGGIIVELQNGAKESIDATSEAGRLLADTLTQAEEAQKGLDAAMKEINKANDSIQNIAAVAEEQAASSKEVANGIDNATRSTMEMVSTVVSITKIVDDTVVAAKVTGEQAEYIKGCSETLTDVLSRFTLISEESVAKPKLTPKQKAPAAMALPQGNGSR
ncbi:MAG: methyl-accepting chemotaxis protein [Synergistaceae bacterium]|jgi:methyl-accepting chemotaxis protein|nr:methyl-accepting chemotaxis protein [Synergistaceae bacterium]